MRSEVMVTGNRGLRNSWTRFGHSAQIVRHKKKAFRANNAKGFLFSAHPARFEHATLGSVDRCSIQLSYGCISLFSSGGEGGIRTLGTLLRYTRLAIVRLRPTRPPPQLSHATKSPKSAEEQGFEPREPFDSTVFKTAAFDHSATPPAWKRARPFGQGAAFSHRRGRLSSAAGRLCTGARARRIW
jgi:hypothetical protein